MPFEKVETQVDFPALERRTLEFWDAIRAFEKRRALNAGKPKWSFLDGPITANNPMGVHHAWGRTYKDAYNRYFAMTGHELRYQNGFDCQGLWVEVEVEKQLDLKTKRDIENLVPGDRFASIDRFVTLCKERVDKYARRQTEQSIRLGYWMDWDRTDADWAKKPGERKSYFTMSDANNYTIWSFLKKCFSRGLVYKGYDAMPWCGRCGVGLSQQEVSEGYALVAHRSVFVKFPLKPRDERGTSDSLGSPPENLLVWTTTPWTLTSNVGAAVNPKLTYLQVKHKDEIYYVAKGAFKGGRLEEQFKKKEWVEGVPKLKSLEQHFKEKGGYEVVGEVAGESLVGRKYEGPFDELEAQRSEYGFPASIVSVVQKQNWAPKQSPAEAHRVVAWEEVGETEGTGIVHIAPGCGKQDFELAVWLQRLSWFGERWRSGAIGIAKDIPLNCPNWKLEEYVAKQMILPFTQNLAGAIVENGDGLPIIAPLDDAGVFVEGFAEFTGRNANDPKTADLVFEQLEKKGRLFATEKYPHSYPHCWRCKTELLFRLVDEWFISVDRHYVEESDSLPIRTSFSFRDRIAAAVEQGGVVPNASDAPRFLPESISGKARELDWLRNMGDWMISKKRYWGLALPIWVDAETGDFEVIGGYEELKARAVEGWDQFEGHDPHRPWIDLVKIRNPKTGNLMSRIGDVGNPWLDAGIVPYSTMMYAENRAEWTQWFPADFITECFPGQFRNWFYSLLAMSTMMTGRPPFKVLLGHALVRDEHGEEMHKSAGNSIPFEGAANDGYEVSGKKYPPMSADVMRWMYCRQPSAQNINFGPHIAEEVRGKVHLKLWNTYAFFCNYARLDGFDPADPQVPIAQRPDIDRWILSDLQELIRTARASFEAYDIAAFCHAAETFLDDKLSNWYVRRNRRRFWKSDKGADKEAAYQTLYEVLLTVTKLIAPITPFLAEVIYRNLVGGGADFGPIDPKNDASRDVEDDAESEAFHLDHPESVHLCDYPVVEPELVDAELSADMEALLRIVSLGQAVRQTAKIKVRQPLAELVVQPATDADRRAVERFADQITEELNIKRARLHDPAKGPLLAFDVKINPKVGGPKFGQQMGAVTAALSKTPTAVESFLAGKSVTVMPDGSTAILVEPGDVWVQPRMEKGFSGLVDHGTQLLLDGRITPELAAEGMAREIIRHVQNARKEADLQPEDRIVLRLVADGDLPAAIDAHWTYIAGETLATKRSGEAIPGAFVAEVKVEGKPLRIELKKA